MTRESRSGVLLHIGPHKTGTTTVQRALVAHRADLARHGISYPGKSDAPHGAVIARLGTHHGWYDELEPFPIRRWERFCAVTRSLDDLVVVSSEAMCHADDEQARLVCGELHPGPARVVITLRPLENLLPSSWQEYVKAGWTTSYSDFLDWTLRRADDPANPVRTFWIRQDHGRLVERWARAVGTDRVVVVVADRGRPRMLLDSFEDLLDLPRGLLGTTDHGEVANRSLTWPECEMLRSINGFARDRLTWAQYNSLFRSGAFRHLVDDRRPSPDERRLGLPAWAVDEARRHGQRAIDRIRASGVSVIGSLDDLSPGTAVEDWTSDDVTEVPLDACVVASAGLVAAMWAAISGE